MAVMVGVLFDNLYNRFRNLSNVYFLFISILQCPPVSSAGPVPLSLVLIANMAEAALEDISRKRMTRGSTNLPPKIAMLFTIFGLLLVRVQGGSCLWHTPCQTPGGSCFWGGS